jgi:hypothetical protein
LNIAPEEPTLRGVGGGQGVFTDCTSPIPPKTPPLFLFGGGGGGKGVFTVSLPKNGTARSLSPPSPTSCPGQINVAQARHCTSPIPPEEPALHGMRGGGQGVFTVARRPRTALQVAYPPPEKPTIRVMGGGGAGGVQRGVAQARQCTSLIPPYPTLPIPPYRTSPIPPYPHPPQYVLEKSKLQIRLTYLVVYQKRQTTTH